VGDPGKVQDERRPPQLQAMKKWRALYSTSTATFDATRADLYTMQLQT
jgi:hypothetical protein